VDATFDMLIEELLGIAVLSAGVGHYYYPREEETSRTRQEHSVIQPHPASSETHFRLGENGWEQRDPEATEWQLADPEKLKYKPTGEVRTSNGLDLFLKHYNRANPGDAIDKKKSAYQEELDDLKVSDPSSKRAILLSKLLPLCEQARDYQYKIVGHLLKVKEKREEKKGEVSNKVTSLACATLENVIQLNDAPNAVERLITQIEKDDKALCRSQELSAEIRLKIAARIAAGDDPSDELLEAQRLIISSVTRYNELIDARIASAKSLKPPYEKEGTQKSEHVGTETSGTSEEKKNLYLKEFRAIKDYYSAQSKLNDSDRECWAPALLVCVNAIRCFITEPSTNIKGIEKVATAYLQAANYCEKAATAQAAGKDMEADYWNNAGRAYYNLAIEQAKANPSPAVVESYTQAINYYEKAIQATASGKDKEAVDLCYTGFAYYNLAIEQDRPTPRQAVVESYTQAANYYEKAATALADGKEKEAEYWNRAGIAYVKIAEEQAKDEPNKGTVRSLEHAIFCYQHAAKAEADGEHTEAIKWGKYGDESMEYQG
jgi:hypothetical protein